MTCCASPLSLGLRGYQRRTVQPTITVAPQYRVVEPAPIVTPKTTPTPMEVVDLMLQESQLTPDDEFYDLGCGDGRVVIRAAQRFGCRCVGIDINADQARIAKRAVERAGLQSLVTIYKGDVTRCDVSQATAAYIYLEPETLAKVVPRLSPGCRIASYSHTLATFNHRVSVDGQSVYFWIPQR